MIFALIFVVGCGAKSTNQRVKKDFYQKEMQLLVIEKQCQNPKGNFSPLTMEINKLYAEMIKKNPMAGLVVPPKFFDYQNPLKITISGMEQKLEELRLKLNSSAVDGEFASEVFYLYQNANRFESLKCSFQTLAQKKNLDFRPMKMIEDLCQKKDGVASCSEQTIGQMTVAEEEMVKASTLDLCRSFKQDISCQTEWQINDKKGSKAQMIKSYQDRFRKEKFNKLFELRSGHQRFQCAEIVDDDKNSLIVMKINVDQGLWEMETLKALLRFVSLQWSNPQFKLEFEIVGQNAIAGETVIQILNTSNFNSFVPDNNTRVVYLSDKLDFLTKQKVLAHEIGHVLGFPDCYIEFFDEKKKELIYYEQSNTDTNIMCSLKNSVRASEAYIQQLREKSCLFL